MLDLTSYSNSEYLSCLFGLNKTILEIWAIDWGKASTRSPILAYAMISPADEDLVPRRWRSSDFSSLSTDQHARTTIVRMAKASIVDIGSTVAAVISSLIGGQSLHEACLSCDCPVPSPRFDQIKLGSQQEIEKRFFVRPPTVSLSRESVLSLSGQKQGSTSPQSPAIAVVGSIFRIDKQTLWLDENNRPIQKAYAVMREMIARLSSQTNMRFFASDSKRLGNIEFFSFPATDYRNRSMVTVETDPEPFLNGQPRSCRRIMVNLLPGAFAGSTNLLVNCRLFNDNEIISDECKEGPFPQNPLFSFEASEQVSAGDVRIWQKGHGATSWSFWHQENFDLFRSFSITTSLPSIPHSDWLDKLRNRPVETKDQRDPTISAPTAFDDYNGRISSDFIQDPWHPIGINVVGLCKRLTTPRSSADFFLPTEGNEDARIEKLSSWLEKRREPYAEPGACVIVDPYFDAAGAEAIRTVALQNTEFVVVTNTQCTSFDDQTPNSPLVSRLVQRFQSIFHCLVRLVSPATAEEPEGEPRRAGRIRAYFAQHATDFQGKAVRVLDIRSCGRSTRQYFHDRYLLLFDMKGRLQGGYNLSNSLQGAMKTYPLLITEIPFDLLEPVQNYFHNLIANAAASDYRQIIELYSSQADLVSQRPFAAEGLLALNDPAHLFAELLGEGSIAALRIEPLQKWLLERGLMNENKSFRLPTSLRQAILSAASKKSHDTFRKFWKDVAEILARSNESDGFFASIRPGHKILDELQTFLLDDRKDDDDITALQEKAVRSAKYLTDLCYSQDFAYCLSQASHVPGHVIANPICKYDVHEALRALRIVEPLRLVKVIEDATMSSPTTRGKYVLIKGMDEFALLCVFPSSLPLFSSMAGSRSPFIRSMAAMSHFHMRLESGQNPNPAWVAINFSPREMAMVLAQWVYELRVCANRKGGQEDDIVRMWRESAFNYMRINWPSPRDIGLLAHVLDRAGGPTNSWASSANQDLAIPLIQNGSYALSDLRAYWYGQFTGRIEEALKEHQFFASADFQITANAAHAIVNEGSMIDRSVDEMKVFINDCVKQLLRPRIQATDYETWIRHTQIILLVQSFLEHLLFYKDNLSSQQRKHINDAIALGDSHTFDRSDVMSQESYELVVWAKKVRDSVQGDRDID